MPRPRRPSQFVLFALLALIIAIAMPATKSDGSVRWAAAKGAAGKSSLLLSLSPPQIQQIMSGEAGLTALAANQDLELVSAVKLAAGEARAWETVGCRQYNCILFTFFNFQDGSAENRIYNQTAGNLIAEWVEPNAKPSPSQRIGEIALEVAAADVQVQETLAGIGDLTPTMAPISIWLEEGGCAQDWCVDLTFHAPDGSGRIYHVTINMRQKQVARTFFSRARANRTDAAAIAEIQDAQEEEGPLFENGCRQQYGWDVCWEMTAFDGMDFTNALFENISVFSSAKIGQVEVYYASWPGGYRDEIGAEASVKPKFGTIVTDLGNGFQVDQLFTEPFDWPNCICCYRYTQRLTFYADGSFEPEFIAHGPGCDDPNVYRPFWRIDFDLDGAEGDSVWTWEEDQWTQAATEREISLYEDLNPWGEKIATFDGETHYRWQPVRTDPFGVDDAKVFLLQFHDDEGNFAIGAGEANTYHPPADWVDGEQLSGANGVMWYIPILETKRGGPWWCMPEPAPEFSPCTASVKASPGGELRQPTAEELAQLTATATPLPTPLPASTPTPAPISGTDAETIWLNAGCGSCHTLSALNEESDVAPDLSNIGQIAGSREPDKTATLYLREALADPNLFIVEECPTAPCNANVMPDNYAQILSPDQMDTLVAYLLAQVEDEADLPPAIDEGTPSILPTISSNEEASSSGQFPLGIIAGISSAVVLAFIWLYFNRNGDEVEPES